MQSETFFGLENLLTHKLLTIFTVLPSIYLCHSSFSSIFIPKSRSCLHLVDGVKRSVHMLVLQLLRGHGGPTHVHVGLRGDSVMGNTTNTVTINYLKTKDFFGCVKPCNQISAVLLMTELPGHLWRSGCTQVCSPQCSGH